MNSPLLPLIMETASQFLNVPQRLLSERKFKCHFGVSPMCAAVVWSLITLESAYPGVELIHVLWLLLFLTCYPKQDELESLTGSTNKTIKLRIENAARAVNQSLDNVG